MIKKILIIGESFFGYVDRIKSHLEQRDITVDIIYTFVPTFEDRAKRKLFKKEFDEQNYYEQSLKAGNVYDLILVINGKKLPEKFIDNLKKFHPTTRKILYVWDDLDNLQQSDNFFSIFSKKYTYSKFDADRYPEFIFQPFFFSHQSNVSKRIIGASFVGTLHSDRYQKLQNLKKINPAVSFYFYLYTDLMSYIKFMKNTKLKDVKFKTLEYAQYIEAVAKSKALIELPHIDQKNITTRAIEVLGTKTKLITTSEAVKNYDFYNPENIFIINATNSDEISAWLDKDYKDYTPELLNKYHIESWLNVILN